MEYLPYLVSFIAWSFGAAICALIALHGSKLVKGSQKNNLIASKNDHGFEFNASFSGGLFLTIAGLLGLIFTIYEFWEVIYALTLLSYIALRRQQDNASPESNDS